MSLLKGRARRDPQGPNNCPDRGQAKRQEPQPPSSASITLCPASGLLSWASEGFGIEWCWSKRENDDGGNKRWRRTPLETGGGTLRGSRGWLMASPLLGHHPLATGSWLLPVAIADASFSPLSSDTSHLALHLSLYMFFLSVFLFLSLCVCICWTTAFFYSSLPDTYQTRSVLVRCLQSGKRTKVMKEEKTLPTS